MHSTGTGLRARGGWVKWGTAVVVAFGAMTAAPSMQSQTATPAVKAAAATTLPPKLALYKKEVVTNIDGMYDFTQRMVDSVFSFGELGFQEYETQKYLTGIL